MCKKCEHPKESVPDVFPNIDWSQYAGPATRWVQNLPQYKCPTCGVDSIFKECVDCQDKDDTQ